MKPFSLSEFQDLLRNVTDFIGNKPLDQSLQNALDEAFPPSSELFRAVTDACNAGIESGDLCSQQAGGIAFGRIIKATPSLAGCSVDVVKMKDVVGPHHRHPKGEIDMIMPISDSATFDGKGAGWMVYEPNSAHKPTVSNGEAVILYLLPSGEIEFTR